jgi:hypothetical protein
MGGNVFKDVTPFDHKQIPEIESRLNSVLTTLSVRAIPFGSVAKPTPGKVSGDYDTMVDENFLSRYFGEKNPRNIRKTLKDRFTDAGYEATLNGIAVHVKVPVEDKFYQADVMVVPNTLSISQFHIHDIPKGSPYKGVHKHLALFYVARSKGLLWSAFQGLYTRNSDGSRGDFITYNPEKVAYLLFGTKADKNSLNSFEDIVRSMPEKDVEEMIEFFKTDPSWKV